MYWVYILENAEDQGWYIGYTSNLKRRLAEHQAGMGSQTTSRKNGWRLIYCEGYVHQKDAEDRERYLKSGAGRTYLKKQMRHYLEK